MFIEVLLGVLFKPVIYQDNNTVYDAKETDLIELTCSSNDPTPIIKLNPP